jgi:hypothetical protein
MKKYYLSLLMFVLPMLVFAQVHNAENFNVGDELHYMVCTMPDSPEHTGMSVIWDFSSVIDSGNGQHTTWILDDTSSADPNDLVQSPGPIFSNSGSKIHKTGTQSFLTGTYGQATYSYDAGVLIIDRTLTYGLMDSNAYSSSLVIATNTLTGSGTSKIEVDGSGTLKTPSGTFNNVLRVKRTFDNVDSIPGSSLRNLQIIYLWYDSLHTAPLFRVDSLYRTGTGFLVNGTTTTGTAQYLQAVFPTAVNNVARSGASAFAHLDNNGLLIKAALKPGREYRLNLFNISGQKVYTSSFTASSTEQRLDIGRQLAAGSYIIELVSSGVEPTILKVVKQ